MSNNDIRQKLHQFIDEIDDDEAEAMYTLWVEEESDNESRKQLVQKERERYLAGTQRGFTWEEVKAMAANKELRNAL